MRALLLVTLVAAAPVWAASATRTIERTLPGRPVVLVVHRYGDVSVTGSDRAGATARARVRVEASSQAAAEAFASSVRLLVSERGETAVVATEYPTAPGPDTGLSFGADIELDLPAALGVAVMSQFGDVRVFDVAGPSRIEHRYGDVEVARVGDCAINSRYGEVRIEDARGRLAVNSGFGDIRLVGLDDSSRVEHRYGSVEVRDCHRHARVDNLWGDVRLAMGRGLPFILDGHARQGNVRAPRPLVVSDDGSVRLVTGQMGRGGPLIEVHTVMGDIEVQRK
ncbi:MAG: DUF4097 family beta strand repeat-containing protein [bacterium]